MEWLKPFMTERKYRKGDIVCKKDDTADENVPDRHGNFRVTEIGIELRRGA